MISALFLIAGIHSTTNLKTFEQATKFFNPANTQSSSEEFLTIPYYWYVFPYHLVQYANTEFDIDDVGLFPTLSNIYNGAVCENS